MSLEKEVFGGSKSEAVLREKPAKKRGCVASQTKRPSEGGLVSSR
jgi:hypothetical protein